MQTISQVLAKLTVETPGTAIPEVAIRDARKFLLDCCATAVAARHESGVEPILDMIRDWGGAPQATAMFTAEQFPVPAAVLLNGTMIHALDFDDVHIPGALHITASVVPVALAYAEQLHRSGREMLEAIVIGVEVGARLSTAHRARRTHLGFLQASVVGGFGAVATAARLMALSVEQTVHAFGIYYAQACGNRQALYDTALTKRMQPAFAGKAAVVSAQLAARGVTGATHPFDGQAGLFRIFGCAGEPPTADDLEGIQEPWQINCTSVKRFPSCGAAHPGSQIALTLLHEEGWLPEKIRTVELFLPPESMELVGFPFSPGDSPQVSAQFSAAYAVATAFTAGRVTLQEYTNTAVLSNEIAKKFMDRIQIRPLSDWVGTPADTERTQIMRVTGIDGSIAERTLTLGIDIITPTSVGYDQVREKLFECASYSGVLDATQVERLATAIDDFANLPDVHVFSREYLQTSDRH